MRCNRCPPPRISSFARQRIWIHSSPAERTPSWPAATCAVPSFTRVLVGIVLFLYLYSTAFINNEKYCPPSLYLKGEHYIHKLIQSSTYSNSIIQTDRPKSLPRSFAATETEIFPPIQTGKIRIYTIKIEKIISQACTYCLIGSPAPPVFNGAIQAPSRSDASRATSTVPLPRRDGIAGSHDGGRRRSPLPRLL